jgi:hypothetical protein
VEPGQSDIINVALLLARNIVNLPFIATVLSASTCVAVSRPQKASFSHVRLAAGEIIRQGDIRKLRGNAQIETETFLMSADEIDFDSKNHGIKGRGDVRISPK